ncbi:PDZ domain-containing protein [Deinococcus detaillensis]|uniref:PDZ domain-containing protein n=1 Tax=Deinococcus detaillensis TaxID=2592048 RepID=A0A553V4X6_9DEIO|nr:trypsin-like peptidase domain-containing protein [Deinococcus detaillensis]TSA87540.1 PDZ domain-containing protein [Deinococcus detaillensis]
MSTGSSKTKKAVLAVSAALALGIGGVALYEHNSSPSQTAQTQSGQTTLVEASLAQAVPAKSAVPVFNPVHAKTENERNTVDVVRAAQDGLVYVSVQSGTKTATAPPKGSGNSGKGQQGGSQGSGQADPFAGTPFQGMPFGQGGQDGGSSGTPQGPQRGTGSGFFVDAKGDILTNYHVVDGADTITIRVHNHPETYTAKVIGTAPDYDLALIRADGLPKNLIKPIPLGNSDGLEPGLKAIALGAPFDLDFSVTEGIISSNARTIPVGTRDVNQSVIQTDAAINPGNSGGPLLDSSGQVIGINTQILSGGSDQNAGVGFAIPINTAKSLLPRLEAGSKITTPVLGLRYADLASLDSAALKALNLPSSGALVQEVLPGSPAAKAGLKAGTQKITLQDGTPLTLGGDVILSVNGKLIGQNNSLQSAIFGLSLGDSVKLSIKRGGKVTELSVKLSEFAPPTNS